MRGLAIPATPAASVTLQLGFRAFVLVELSEARLLGTPANGGSDFLGYYLSSFKCLFD
jgi:hypothetical protein